MKKRQKILSLFLAVIMLLSVVPMTDLSIEASAVTFAQLNDSSVFLKQQESRTCTLCASAMMMRRYSMLRGDSGWNTITESSIKSTAWLNGAGLYNSFSYSNSSVSTIKVANYSLPGGSSNKSAIIEELKKCPEGIVLYNGNAPHAILLTDYTDGVFYCADPANGIASGRIPISQAYKVTINNATSYWKVTSPVVDGPTEHIHDYSGDRLYQPEHPHEISQRCVDYDNCGGFIWTGENYKDRSCSQCWDLKLEFSKSSATVEEGKSVVVNLTKSGSCYPEGAVFYLDYDKSILNVTTSTLSCNIEALKAGSCQLTVTVYSDRNKSSLICSDSMSVTVVETSYTLSYNANGGSGAPSSQDNEKSYTISSTVPTKFGYTFLGWSTSSSASSASYKPGNTINLSSNTTLYAVWKSANSISIDNTYSATIGFANQEYFYTFSPSTNDTYVFESTGSLDAKIYLYDSSGAEVATNDDSGADSNFKLVISLTAGKKYYIKLRAFNSKTGSTSFNVVKKPPTVYTLSYDATGGSGAPSSQTGATSYTISSTIPTRRGYTFMGWTMFSTGNVVGHRPGETIDLFTDITLYAIWKEAEPMLEGEGYEVSIDFAKQELYYTFTPTVSGEYAFESFSNIDTRVYVYNSSWSRIGYNDDGGVADNFLLHLDLVAGNKYYVKVGTYGSYTGDLTFGVALYEEEHTHSYTSSVTTQPTCTKEGVRTYKCSCGTTYTETIAKTSHNSNTIISAVAATCSKTGLTEGKKCSACGTVTVAQSVVAATGHKDNNFDSKCDICGISSTPDTPDEPSTPDTPIDPTDDCSCNCHKGGIAGLFFKFINFFQKLFGMNKVCACGAKH